MSKTVKGLIVHKYLILLFIFLNVNGSDNFSMIYSVEKGGKSLGSYELNINKSNENITSKSSGVANKVKFCLDKEITYLSDGHKRIVFTKNEKIESFEVRTKLSAMDAKTKKEYERKLSKVEQDGMLLITKTDKSRIELFNKRETVIKTLDEVLFDIYNNKINYTKFILFDKLGIMKMVAQIEKKGAIYTIENASKKSGYIAINTQKSLPVEVKSLVSNWKMSLINSGVYKNYTLNIADSLLENKEVLGENAKNITLSSAKLKTTKKDYVFTTKIHFALPNDIAKQKDYQKADFCKKSLKKSGIKYKKIFIEENDCLTTATIKVDKKSYNEQLLDALYEKHEELKATKNIKITKDSVEYRLLKKGQI